MTSAEVDQASEQPAGDEESEVFEFGKNRQWLRDRCRGQSKIGSKHPPCFLCYVPRPVYRFARALEENRLCRIVGRTGIPATRQDGPLRTGCLAVGFFSNFIGFVLTFFAAFAMSRNYDVIVNTGYSVGLLEEVDDSVPPVHITLGLRSVAFDNPSTVGQVVLDYDNFCELSLETDRLQRYLDISQCDDCASVARSMSFSVAWSIVTYLPSLTTDVLRMYSNYDVNCQKSFATLWSIIALALSLNTLLKYNTNCITMFYEGLVYYNANGTVVSPDSPDLVYTVDFAWSIGNGLACLYAGTSLKIVDILCNFFVATPSITRNAKEQAEYERLYGEKLDDEEALSGDEQLEGEETSGGVEVPAKED